MNHLHTILAGRGATLADVNRARDTRFPHRPPLGVAHDVPGKLPLTRIIAVRIEGQSLLRARAEMPGDRGVAVARVANIDRRSWHAAADADRHQYRRDPVVAEAMRPAGLVQHHILGPEARLDYIVTPRPADGQDA